MGKFIPGMPVRVTEDFLNSLYLFIYPLMDPVGMAFVQKEALSRLFGNI